MKEYKKPTVSIVILDFNRPKESELLLHSLKLNVKFDNEIIYVSNGGEQSYIQESYKNGQIDILLLCRDNLGTGIGTKRGFQAASGDYIMYVQVDQWLARPIDQDQINQMIEFLEKHPECFYIDLAGNQGNGNPSERALFINRKKYLDIPDLEFAYGGPGPFAHIAWSEKGLQDYMEREKLVFASAGRIFYDNGKDSVRDYPCGGQIKQETDTKKLYILKPIKERVNFPNLKLTDEEWNQILSGKWINGTVPELHKGSSFVAWDKVFELKDLT